MQKNLVKNNNTYIGVLNKSAADGIVVLDRRDPDIGQKIRIKRKNLSGAPFGLKVEVEYLYQYKGEHFGKIKEILGNPENPATASLAIVKRYGIAVNFPQSVLLEAEAFSRELDLAEIEKEINKGRIDNRDLLTVTIDGLDAKDLDDAISVNKEGDAYNLWVHIADVSHYVKGGSKMDLEAKKRGNSVYLADLVLPMLPARISNGIASLHPDVDRFCFTCKLTIDKAGTVLAGALYPSIIRSFARLSYEEVEPYLTGNSPLLPDRPPAVGEMLLVMQELAEILQAKRKARGAIEFDLPETVIDIDSEGRPIDVRRAAVGRANNIIEEFMIAANEYIAQLSVKNKLPVIYRIHDKPDPDKLQQFQELSYKLGLNFRLGLEPKAAEIAAILRELKVENYAATLSQILLRAMAKAEYSAQNKGHYALAAKDYLHFTAPIRRYSDLVTHRALKRIGKPGKKRELLALEDTASYISVTERLAEAAERDSNSYLIALYLSERIGEEYEGIISSFTPHSFYVQLENTAEGTVMYRDLPDYYRFLEEELAAKNERSGEVLRLGDKVRVKLVRVDINLLQIDFELLRHDSDTGIKEKILPQKKKSGENSTVRLNKKQRRKLARRKKKRQERQKMRRDLGRERRNYR